MIKLKLGLDAIEETVTRPILIKVVEDVIKFFGFNRDIYYQLDEHDTIDREKDNLGKVNSYSSPRKEKLIITHEDMMVDGSDLSMTYVWPDHKAMYSDPDIKASIVPIYLNRKLVLSVKYINKSKSMVNKLISKLRLLTASDDMYIVHDLDYHYNLPNFIFYLLDNINTLKNNHTDPKLDIETYINNTFRVVTTVNAPDGDSLKSNIAVRRRQSNILGYITTNLGEISKTEVENETAWSIEFNYEFNYEMPAALMVKYPPMVYNELIDIKFREVLPKTPARYKGNYTGANQALMDVTNGGLSDYLRIRNGGYYLTIPEDDSYKLVRPDPHTARILSIMVYLDPNDLYFLFNIMDIPNIKFRDAILDFWKECDYNFIGVPYKSVFYFDLYKDGVRDYDNEILMDNNLDLRTKFPMDIKSVYRVAINILTDLNMLSKADRYRLSAYIKSKTLEGNKPPELVEYYANVFNIPSSTLPTRSNSLDIIFSIEDNDWKKFFTRQEFLNIAAVMELK